MTHINTLPSEVLAHIFELGTASPENDFGQDDFPTLVSLVCKSWHALALDTPTLWNTLTLDPSEYPRFTKARTHLARSKGAPLNIYLDFSTRAEPELVRAAIHLILPDLARWRHFVLVVPDFDVMYSAVRLIADAFSAPSPSSALAPYLEVFRLYGPPEFDPTEPEPRALPSPIPVFGSDPDAEGECTPRLRDVVLCGVPVDWALFVPSTLERLQLSLHSGSRRPSFAQFARLVTASPKLHTLILNASGPALDPTDSGMIELHNLCALTLDCFEPEYLERLLGRTYTPSLQDLSLADSAGDSSRVFEMLAISRASTGPTGERDAVGRSVRSAIGSSASMSLAFGSSASFGFGSSLSMALGSNTSFAFGSTFSMVPLPGLTHSTISLDSTTSSSSATSASPTKGAFPNLTSLKLSSVECTPAAFRQLVRGLPNLTSINLDARDADPAVLGMMAESDSDSDELDESVVGGGGIPFPTMGDVSKKERICPLLRTVTCTGVPGSVIRDFVARRERARVPIRTVRVCVASEVEEQAFHGDGDAEEGWASGNWLSEADRAWLEKHVELEFFDEDEEEEVDGGAWWSTGWD
ncbi:hypothetical protein BDV93DRAFT_524611 [Ceratobasidium sp. AG-I]|nr:hypothetical protein BDV93DRAFT_524611 [Ceratobasidium sp. AG-I]